MVQKNHIGHGGKGQRENYARFSVEMKKKDYSCYFLQPPADISSKLSEGYLWSGFFDKELRKSQSTDFEDRLREIAFDVEATK